MSSAVKAVSSGWTFREAAEDTILRLCEQMERCIPGTRAGDDIEALHDMRVASRRLRAAFRVFRDCFKRDKLSEVSDKVGEVTRALGEVRDLDVFTDFLRNYASEHPKASVEWIIERESHIREGVRERMLDSLEKLEKDDVCGSIRRLFDPAYLTDACGDSIAAHSSLIRKRYSKLKDLSRAIGNPNDINGLHQMRIGVKRFRYTLEAFMPYFNGSIQKLVSECKRLQDRLGEVHDCDVWTEKLQNYLNEPGLSNDRLDTIRQLLVDRAEFRQRAYEAAVKQWSLLSGPGFRKMLGRLDGLVSSKKIRIGKEGTEMAGSGNKKAARETTAPAKEWGVIGNGVKEDTTVPETLPDTDTSAHSGFTEAIASARSAVSTAAARLSNSDSSGKLAKQFAKAIALLESIHSDETEFDEDTRSKLEKWLHKLADASSMVPEDGNVTDKQLDKIRDKVRTLRRKVAARLEKQSS